MAFDDDTRGHLQDFVGEARVLLSAEITRQMQEEYGLDPGTGSDVGLESLAHLDDRRLETARILREVRDHYVTSSTERGSEAARAALKRIAREQAFTALNRLAALRLMEARGILRQSVGKGYQSQAFQLYQRVAGTALGDTGEAYRTFLFSLFDTFVADLPALFDRFSPEGLLFPREPTLITLLGLFEDPNIEPLWGEDETIGWIYQYFNDPLERKRMRDTRQGGSQAPRNSRELAVRNQFFTPRYVVEFLIDNTLGRFWSEQTAGKTALEERCQYLLVQKSEALPTRPTRVRDPRTIRLLDPACGSMHFGLYAFDLFEQIYTEAWAFEQQNGPGSLAGEERLPALSQSYGDEAAFLRDVPRLIIEHNIYGVDIDPRAAQIASLALWLRAQRAWHEAGVQLAERPDVARGQVVAAVAPPAELEIRKRVMAELSARDGELFEKMLFLLRGLPELGVLLRVERDLPAMIQAAYREHGPIFSTADADVWTQAELRLRSALIEFAGAAQVTYQSRLFARDALQGLRLIDVLSEKFDVIVMNPPFGALSLGIKHELIESYPNSKNDMLAIFIERSLELLRVGGRVGAITSRTCFFLSSFRDWREKIVLAHSTTEVFVDLGHGVMGSSLFQVGRLSSSLPAMR